MPLNLDSKDWGTNEVTLLSLHLDNLFILYYSRPIYSNATTCDFVDIMVLDLDYPGNVGYFNTDNTPS